MANEAMWTNRCHNRGPCHNCPGAAMDYPVFLGPSDSPICVVAQDPNYTINAAPAERLHSRLLQLARNHAPWQQLEPYIWECRSLDPENQLARVRRRVAEAATYPVEQVYFTNLAKCGRRGAYRTGDGGKLNARIKHCLPYLKDELTLGAGRHTTIVFGKPATKAVAKMFGIRRVPPMTEAGEFRDARERHLIFFRHWSRARAGFLDLPALDNHFRQHPV